MATYKNNQIVVLQFREKTEIQSRNVFSSFDIIKKNGYIPSATDYEISYIADREKSKNISDELNNLYSKLNSGMQPINYYGHSLSVSDIVVITDEYQNAEAYYVDKIGFKQLPDDFVTDKLVEAIGKGIDIREKIASADVAELSDETIKQYEYIFSLADERKKYLEEQQANKISVLRVAPGQYPEVIEIDNTLEALQEQVGGYIETVYPFEDDAVIICNEEGKMIGLPLNRAIYAMAGNEKTMTEIIAGSFLIAGVGEEGDFTSLSSELTEKYEKMFHNPERFFNINGTIRAVPSKPSNESTKESEMEL